MREKELQDFIEDNIGKKYGDEFKYGMINLATWYRGGMDGKYGPSVEICTALPWGFYFSMLAETKSVGNRVSFFEWISEEFVPAFKANVQKER